MSTDAPTEVQSTDARIAGPFTGFDRYGRPDHRYYRCRACGAEAVRREDLTDCCSEGR